MKHANYSNDYLEFYSAFQIIHLNQSKQAEALLYIVHYINHQSIIYYNINSNLAYIFNIFLTIVKR